MKQVMTYGLLTVALVVVLSVGWIGWQRTLGKEIRETNIAITRQTNQYVDSKQSLLLSLLTEYEGSSDGQRRAIAIRACSEATKIDSEFWPMGINSMLAAGGCQ